MTWQVWTVRALPLAATWARGRWGRARCCAWASLPLSWEHAGVGLLPVAALAGVRAGAEADPARRRFHSVLVRLCLLVLRRAHLMGLPDGPAWASGLLGLAPTAAVARLGSWQPPHGVARG